MRAVGGPGRWVWGLSGLATAAVLLVPGVRLLTAAGGPWHRQPAPDTVVRSLTVPEHVTSLDVQSYGGLVRVAAGPVSRAEVIETISYAKQEGGLPAVVQSVSAGRLTLAAPACATSDCTVGFTVTMPAGIPASVTTDGGAAAVSGTAGADVDSGGGPVTAEHIDGSLAVNTYGGSLQMDGAAGADVYSGGGPVTAEHIDGPLTVNTDGGALQMDGAAGADVDSGGGLVTAEHIDGALTVNTDGGALQLNGAPGADVDSGGGPVTAEHIDGPLTVNTDGGALQLTATVGPLRADTGGGPLSDEGADAATADVSTGGGPARIAFSAAPDTVLLSTEGGPVTLTVPGGPYALTTDSDGGPQSVGIATDPAARRSMTVTSDGGSLQIEPASGH